MPEAPTEYYTSRYSGEEIDRGIDGALQLGGATTKQQALRNIGGRPNRNLLDNWYFPQAVNQRGDTSWNGFGYHLDRWHEEGSVAGSISAAGYHVGNAQTVIQRVEAKKLDQILGKTITVSCLLSDGRFATGTGTLPKTIGTENFGVEASFGEGLGFSAMFFPSDMSYQFGRIVNYSGDEVVVVACKTELGSNQTLAYQDEDGNWQLFETPDYGEELDKCQRYLEIIEVPNGIGMVKYGSSSAGVFIPFKTKKRIIPTVSLTGVYIVRSSDNGAAISSSYLSQPQTINPTLDAVTIKYDGILNEDTSYYLGNDGITVTISAEL